MTILPSLAQVFQTATGISHLLHRYTHTPHNAQHKLHFFNLGRGSLSNTNRHDVFRSKYNAWFSDTSSGDT